MNFRQLECFVAIVDEGSFTRAARRIGITQPSLSQHIRALERELDGAVLDRLPRGVSLTPAGRSLLPEARTAVRALERGRQGARSALALELGELEIATVLSMAVGVLPRHIGIWHQRHPNVSIRLHEFRHRTLLEDAVEQGVADFAIGPRPVRRWGRPARDRRLGGVRGRGCANRSAGRPAQCAAGGAKERDGCSTTRTTGSPASSKSSAGAPGSGREGRFARRRPRAPSGWRPPGSGSRSCPTTSSCRPSTRSCSGSCRA